LNSRAKNRSKGETDPRAEVAARDLFVDLIPDIAVRAADYRVSLDVIDDDIYGLFTEQIRDLTGTLTAACARRDELAIRKSGHSLTGLGGTMGFPEISVVGGELSRGAREHNWDLCTGLTERLSRWSRLLIRPSTS
jgi:hypothetical protein